MPEHPVTSVLGTLADGVIAHGDARGRLELAVAGIEIEWWLGVDDGWRLPDADTAHTIRPGVAPAIETRVRVPGGEAVLRAYAAAGPAAPLVVADLENASPAALVVAWVVHAAPGFRVGRVAIEGTTLRVDDRARVELPRAPSRWAVAPRATGVRDAVIGGTASDGRFEPVRTRRGDLEVALLFPVAHRTRTRIAAGTALGAEPAPAVRVANLPALPDIERGWSAALEHGTRTELPDEELQTALDAARATLMLGGVRGGRRDRQVEAEARAWGPDEPALARRAASPEGGADPWPQLRATAAGASASPRRAADWLRTARHALIAVERDRVDVLPHFPFEWLGRPVAVHDAPTRHGRVSFALRWHGARPALLWDVPEGLRVGAPDLDPSWEAVGHAGEALLGEVDATRLLPLRANGPASEPPPGVPIDEPESFT